jgi:hypothetical protein
MQVRNKHQNSKPENEKRAAIGSKFSLLARYIVMDE